VSPKPLRPAAKPLPASHESSIPLETEPLVFFHPTRAGLSRPGGIQPVDGTLLLEEEPATWPQLAQ
jgi:hypothetical protein